jgi:hypothetical protein
LHGAAGLVGEFGVGDGEEFGEVGVGLTRDRDEEEQDGGE